VSRTATQTLQPAAKSPSAMHGILQRKCDCGATPDLNDRCEACRKKSKGQLQRHAASQSSAFGPQFSEAPPIVHEVLRSPGQPLDLATRTFMESLFAHDFSQVRVHADARAGESARSVNALAYTVGSEIVFAQHHYQPATSIGQRLLAHELTHTVQQSEHNAASAGRLIVGPVEDTHEREADRFAERVSAQRQSLAHDIPPAIQRSNNAPAPTLQRKVMLKGAEMPKKDREALIKARKWSNTTLARAIMEDMAAATDAFDFTDEHELETEIVKRISTTQHMKESQQTVEKIPGDKRSAFGYPFTLASLLYGPRVNYAARDYWEPPVPDAYALRTDKKKNKELTALPRHERCKVYGDQCGLYSWRLSAKGKADPYEAIIRLFVPQPPHKRTLIHCDYLVSMVNFRSFADSIGVSEFNKRVKAYGVEKIRLSWNAFQDLEAEFYQQVKVGGKDALVKRKGLGSLQRVTPSSEADLVIGDHVLFFNRIAYDPLNAGTGNAWRLENAILIGKDGRGQDIFLGHGSGRRTAAELRDKLRKEFNIVAKAALDHVEKAKSKDAKVSAQAVSVLSTKFNVKQVGSEWHIQGSSTLCTSSPVPVDEKLRLIEPKEVLGPRSPCDPSKMFPVDRPIESAK